MTKRTHHSPSDFINHEGAIALLAAILSFLHRNDISKEMILRSVRHCLKTRKSTRQSRHYKKKLQAYEDMGTIMSVWFSSPRFLDERGRPLPLSLGRAHRSLTLDGLVRHSRVKITLSEAVQLMKRSPSIKIDCEGHFTPLKRVFVLREFEVPRAALVVERYLDTLGKNASAHRNGTTLLLERNCHVPELDLKMIAPVLRDIKNRGTAFMDSVDGDIEARRPRKTRQKSGGELGVLIFAWTRPSKVRVAKSNSSSNI
jgi:hypothetical protein